VADEIIPQQINNLKVINPYIRGEKMARMDSKVTLRFTFISEPEKPVVTVQVPKEMLFQEALVLAAKKQGKDPGVLSATYPAGTPITGGTVERVIEQGTNIHVIDPTVVG
jgi:hypothetical protein